MSINCEHNYFKKYTKFKNKVMIFFSSIFKFHKGCDKGREESLEKKVIDLQKKLDSVINIVEMNKHINLNISNKNLIYVINDMIIGVLGATYSSIYIVEGEKLKIKTTNINNKGCSIHDGVIYNDISDGNEFIINSKEVLFDNLLRKRKIHSVIGSPIYLGEKFIGYIVVEHNLNNFFGYDHIKFMSGISNITAIALENHALYNKVKNMAIRDCLLGIYNKKYFMDKLNKRIMKNKNNKFAIVMLDLDDFKKRNDEYGHQFGDEVLKNISNIILEKLQSEDLFARYGGEEFIIYIDKFDDKESVYKKIDDIRKQISNEFTEYGYLRCKTTISGGIAYYPIDIENINLDGIISIADRRLYKAKSMGKNIIIYE